MNSRPDAVKILGSRVHLVTLEEVLDTLEQWIREPGGTCRQVVVTGFHGLWEAHCDAELRRTLNAAALWVPDGIAPVWIARWRGRSGAQRIPGADLLRAFLERGRERRYRSFFFGDTPETLAALQAVIGTRYAGNVIAGVLSPPFREVGPEEDAAQVAMINAAQPDVLWVGLGTPKQDRWIYRHLPVLRVPVAIGVGAAFGFVAGTVPRAPAWMGRMGLEWLYRLLREPRKCWRRSLVQGPRFLAHVLLELTGLRKYD